MMLNASMLGTKTAVIRWRQENHKTPSYFSVAVWIGIGSSTLEQQRAGVE